MSYQRILLKLSGEALGAPSSGHGIDPETGDVTGWIDASSLIPPDERDGEAVLNGIAYQAESGTFLLTGKNWPTVFEVEFVPE